MACTFRPIFEHTSSKKWCISMLYDPSTLVLTLNTEGKHFPQKLFYFQQQSGGGVVSRKYNFYTENVIASITSMQSDYVYTSNIRGQIARISKQDICRHLIKSKEKLKNKQVQLVFGPDDKNPEIVSEAYLYAEKEAAITNLTISSTAREAPDQLFFSKRDGNYISFITV